MLTFRCSSCNKKNYIAPADLRVIREQVRVASRARIADRKGQKQRELQDQRTKAANRAAEVQKQSADLDAYAYRLQTLLQETLDVDDYIEFDTFKEVVSPPSFDPGDLSKEGTPPRLDLPPQPPAIGRFVPGSKTKHEEQVRDAQAAYEQLVREYEAKEDSRRKQLEEAKTKHEEAVRKLEQKMAAQHAEIHEVAQRFDRNDANAIVYYFSRVLEASSYPNDFPRHTKMAYTPESKQLVVEFQLPAFDVIPEVKSYKYVKTKDEVVEAPRPLAQRKSLYASVISQVALRTLHEIFEADRHGKIETIVFNGYVDTVDKATGQAIRPYLVTLRTTRDAFEGIDLGKVTPEACLKGLNAGVSRSPSELAPVRPVLDFRMVDPRFIEETDVLSELDTRPNLMELSPTEFESLITNLFEKMGLETRATRPSRDGGVDCVAWDNRPIFGGRVVIQAKRYKNTVGVAAVRDLFGTLHNEGANKGILVTTSGYGKAAFDFVQGKPMELLDGSNLLYLLKEHSGVEAKIEPPEDWVDPSPEMIEST